MDRMRLQLNTIILALLVIFLSINASHAVDKIWMKDATVNGKSIKLTFDSADNGIWLYSNAAKQLGLTVGAPTTNAIGNTNVYVFKAEGNSFRANIETLKDPSSNTDGFMGWGVVSSNFVEIDANGLKVSFLQQVPQSGDWTLFPIMTNFGSLDLEVPHEDGTTGIVVIDTGDPYGMGLTPRLWQQWKNAHPYAPTTIRADLTTRGLSVEEESLAEKIKIGRLVLADVPVMEANYDLYKFLTNRWGDKLDGVLGLGALRRLDLIADGVHKIAYLRAKTMASRPYSYNRLGAVFIPTAGHPRQGVADVVFGSPAYAAGVRNGDVLLQVDNVRVIGWTDNWQSRFELPAGTTVRLKLQRGGTNFETTATLCEILQPKPNDSDDRIWISSVTINGKPANFIFDSGANEMAIASNAVRRFGLKVVRPETTNDFAYTDDCTVSMCGISFQADLALLDFPQNTHVDCDGIVDWDTVHSNIIGIDGDGLEMAFLTSIPTQADNWARSPIMTNFGLLDIEVPHEDGTTGIIAIDTGRSAGVELSPRLWKQWRDMHPHSPTSIRKEISLFGLSVQEETLADKINIGPIILSDVPILEPESKVFKTVNDALGGCLDGILGLGALRRLDLVADGVHNMAYMRAKTTSSRPYSYNRLGAVFVHTAEHPDREVAKVVSGSPAYDAGVRDGDTLMRVDNNKVAGKDWERWFEQPAGTQLPLTLQRNGTNFETTAILREILSPKR